MTRGRSNCLRRSSPRRPSDTPRTGPPARGACRRPRSTCSQQIRAESRSIPPTALEGRLRDSNSRASVPSDCPAPYWQYASSGVNKYVVYTISRGIPSRPRSSISLDTNRPYRRDPSDPLQPGQKPHEAARNPKVRMERDVDVLVIGAGPTGSTAAKYAARGGADVLLVKKRSEIGTPVRCGEGVAKRWLDEIGLTPSGEFICHEVEGVRVIAPDGAALVVDETRAGNECGYVLERDLFDRYLAKEAAKAGVEILIKTSAVGLLRDDGQIIGARCEHMAETFEVRAKVVIGADGFESQVGRWAGLETHLRTRDIDACLQYTMVGVAGDPRYNDVYLGSCAPGGYAWVFWKQPDVANVGIGVNLSKIRDRAEAKRYLDALIARTPSLAKGEIIEEVAGAVSVSMPLEKTIAPGLILAGDAARLIDPLTGGGVLNGCLSGKYAGEVAADAVSTGKATEEALSPYERRWRARLEEELARHYLFKERLIRLDDETVNRAIHAIVEAKVERITAANVLDAIRQYEPGLLTVFEGFL